jgi:membrane protein DedA with SNARE-associated domain
MKPFTTIAVLLLAFIAIVQGLRFMQAWPVSINGYDVPVVASAVASLVCALLAAMVWRESRRR